MHVDHFVILLMLPAGYYKLLDCCVHDEEEGTILAEFFAHLDRKNIISGDV
jgi:hypothetical protein